MKPSFILLKTECCNTERNAPCRIILQKVENGELGEMYMFCINPEDAPFEGTVSRITREELQKYPTFKEQWNKIYALINTYDILVATGEGLDAHVLFNTLILHHIPVPTIKYVGAKNICRRGISEFPIFNLSWLAYYYLKGNEKYYEKEDDIETEVIARQWAVLVIKATEKSDDNNMISFCENHKIKIGCLSSEGIEVSHIIKKKKVKDIDVDIVADESNPFCYMNVVFTGKMNITREDAQKMVKKIGGNLQDNVTKETDYLVVGTQDLRIVGSEGLSVKQKKAKKLRQNGSDIEIIDENEFLQMMNNEK